MCPLVLTCSLLVFHWPLHLFRLFWSHYSVTLRAVLQEPNFFLLRTAPRDHQPLTATNCQPPPTASRQQRPTANHCQPLPTTNHQPPTATNRHQLPIATNLQPPIATGHG